MHFYGQVRLMTLINLLTNFEIINLELKNDIFGVLTVTPLFKYMSEPILKPKKWNRLLFVSATDFNTLQPKNAKNRKNQFS